MGLQKRNNLYHSRIRVPADLVITLGKREIVKSLKTASYRHAQLLCRQWETDLFRHFSVLRTSSLKPESPFGRAVLAPASRQDKPISLIDALAEYREIRVNGLEQETALKPKALGQFDIAASKFTSHFKQKEGRPIALSAIHPEQLSKFVQALCDSGVKRTTIRKDISFIKTFYGFVLKKRTYLGQEPFAANILGSLAVNANDATPRDIVEIELMAKVLSCLSKGEDKYWALMLLILTGMRPGEVLQLYRDDFEYIDGVWWVYVRAGRADQSLKTMGSFRAIPIHSRLIDAGFAVFLELRSTRLEERLFSLSGETLSKWFSRKVRYYGGASNVVMYSLRHTFAHGLRINDVGELEIARLLGHTTGKMITERYGRGVKPARLLYLVELVGKLDYRLG